MEFIYEPEFWVALSSENCLAIPVNSQFNSHSTVSLHSVAAAGQASLDL